MGNFFQSIGVPGLIIILVVVLIFFGPTKLPELAKGLGKTVKEFKKGVEDVEDDIKETKKAVESSPKKKEEDAAPETAKDDK